MDQKGHSPEHEILQLVEQINQSFEKNEFTLGVFVGLSKAFDTVDHQILLKKFDWFNWFNSNKLPLNVKKTKFSFFRKSSKKDNFLLRLQNLNINGFTAERKSSIKFVWTDENLI